MRSLSLALAVSALSACALTDKAPPVEIRYFSPERYETVGTEAVDHEPAAEKKPIRLRLGRVTASAHLRARIAYRTSAHEIGTYDTLRWSDNPEEFVRRGLERALFEQLGFSRVSSDSAPLLEVELVSFDELRRGDERVGQIALRYALWSDKRVVSSGAMSLEQPAKSAGITDVVSALGLALERATHQLAELVSKRLEPDSVQEH